MSIRSKHLDFLQQPHLKDNSNNQKCFPYKQQNHEPWNRGTEESPQKLDNRINTMRIKFIYQNKTGASQQQQTW